MGPDGIEVGIVGGEVGGERRDADKEPVLDSWGESAVENVIAYGCCFASDVVEEIDYIDSLDNSKYSTCHNADIEDDGQIGCPFEFTATVEFLFGFSAFSAGGMFFCMCVGVPGQRQQQQRGIQSMSRMMKAMR